MASFANRRVHGLLLEPYRPVNPIGTNRVGGYFKKKLTKNWAYINLVYHGCQSKKIENEDNYF